VVTLSEIPMKALTLEPVAVELSSQSFLRLLDGPMMVAWAVATGLLALPLSSSFVPTLSGPNGGKVEREGRPFSFRTNGDRRWWVLSSRRSFFRVGAGTWTTGP